MSIPSRPLSRALRAALAVTLAGNAAACGTDPNGSVDAGDENGGDSTADGTVEDSGESDGIAVTPDTATEDTAAIPDAPDSIAPEDTAVVDVAPDTEPSDVALDTQLPDLGVDADPILADARADVSADAVDIDDVVEDASTDTGGDDVQVDAADLDVADAAPDVISVPLCKDETDGICPEDCTEDNDYDCCVGREDEGLFCSYFGDGGGCGCAVEGPFAPPSTRRLVA
jgi:hypothetical protein